MLLTFRLESPLGPVMQQVFGQVCAGSIGYFSAELGRYPDSLVKFWEVLSQLMKKRPNYLAGVASQLVDLLLLGETPGGWLDSWETRDGWLGSWETRDGWLVSWETREVARQFGDTAGG